MLVVDDDISMISIYEHDQYIMIDQNQLSKMKDENNLRVFVRVRPHEHSLINIEDQQTISIVDHQANSKTSFTFNQVFHQLTPQSQIYGQVASPILHQALLGINGTIITYGQVSSGKTYTIIGNKSQTGILPNIIHHIIQYKNNNKVDLTVKLSIVEIYNEKIKDILDNKDNLNIRCSKARGIYIEGVTQATLQCQKKAQELIWKTVSHRPIESSKSHLIFLIHLYSHNLIQAQTTTSRITIIDLAATDRHTNSHKVLEDTKQINKSLVTLGKVIHALTDPKTTYIPYRDSKLTRLLQESLGGNCLTSIIINISPHQHQTINSLRFGYRAKSILNQPTINKLYTIDQLLVMLEKAETKIRNQAKKIQTYQKCKGFGLGLSNNSVITMHVLADEEDSDGINQQQPLINISNRFLKEIYQNVADINTKIPSIQNMNVTEQKIVTNDINKQSKIIINNSQQQNELKWTKSQYNRIKIKLRQQQTINSIQRKIIQRKNAIIGDYKARYAGISKTNNKNMS